MNTKPTHNLYIPTYTITCRNTDFDGKKIETNINIEKRICQSEDIGSKSFKQKLIAGHFTGHR